MAEKIVSTSIIQVLKKKFLFWRTTMKINYENAKNIHEEAKGRQYQEILNERIAHSYKVKPLKKK